MKKITLQSFSDPGHGWLKCKRKLLVDLGIAESISRFSYESSSSSMPLWSNNLLDTTRLPNPRAEMIINGYPMLRTLQMPRNGQWLTSSNQSSILFGNFNDVVMAMWGGLEIVANSLGDGFNSGSVDVRAIQTIDIGVRRTESFAAVRDFAET